MCVCVCVRVCLVCIGLLPVFVFHNNELAMNELIVNYPSRVIYPPWYCSVLINYGWYPVA